MKLFNLKSIAVTIKGLLILFIYTFCINITIANVADLKFENSLKAVLTGEDGLIMLTEDGGYSWSQKNCGITNVLTGIDILPGYRLNGSEVSCYFISAENGVVLRSFDNCNNWDIIITNTLNHLNDICIVSRERIFAAGDNGTIIYTTDLGNAWNSVFTGINENLNDLAVNTKIYSFDMKTIAAAGNNGTIMLSYDLGNTWNMPKSITSNDLNSIVFADKQFVFAAGKNGTVLRSADNGLNWQSMNTGTNLDLYKICYLKDGSKTDIICSGQGVFLLSHDLGNTWLTISAPANGHLPAMDFGTSLFGMAAGIENEINYTTDGGLTWQINRNRQIDKTIAEEKNINLGNYPNPFNPETKISFTVSQASFISLKVYNTAGAEIKEITSGNMQPGEYQFSFNAGNLPSGVYFYKLILQNNNFSINETKKMILVK